MLGDDELVRLYLADLETYPAIQDEEQERSLLIAARGGDRRASHQLVVGNLRLAAEVAMAHRPSSMHTLDAIQEANVVLVRLVDDPTFPALRDSLANAIREHLEQIAGQNEP